MRDEASIGEVAAPLVRAPRGIAGIEPMRFRASRGYDVLTRLPILLWASGLAFKAAVDFGTYEHGVDPMTPDLVFAVNVAMRLAVIAFFVTLAASVLLRERPAARATGLEPRLSALIGTFLIAAVVLFPHRELSLPAGVVSTVLVLFGNAAAVATLADLGCSFSIMPEARSLVVSGPYRYVRHPLYLAEMIAAVGTVMQYLSIWTGLILAIQIAFQLRRIRHEERVLMKIFPEYAAYRRATAQLVPWVY